jgi:hypothetical protein
MVEQIISGWREHLRGNLAAGLDEKVVLLERSSDDT